MNIVYTNNPYCRRLVTLLTHPVTVGVFGLFWIIVAAIQWPLFVDEARWSYVARLWVHYKSPPYIGAMENKPPFVYCLIALGDILFGTQYWFPRLIGILSVLITSVLIYRLGKKWHDHWSGLIAMAIFLLASAWASFDGYFPGESETFIVLFTTLAFYWIAKNSLSEEDRLIQRVIAGIFMGTAIGFKQSALTSAIALAYFVACPDQERCAVRQIQWRDLLGFGGGMLIATLISIVPLWMSGGSIHDYIEGAWKLLFNHGDFGGFPGSFAPWQTRLNKMSYKLFRTDFFLFTVCFFYLYRNRKLFSSLQVPVIGLLAWMIGDCVGIQLSGYYFPHQFRQYLPSLALASGLSIRNCFDSFAIKNSQTKEIWYSSIIWILILYMIWTPNMPAVAESWNRIIHRTPAPEEEVGLWVKNHTTPSEYVYGIGEQSDLVQFYAMRRSSSRYYNSYYINASVIPEVTEDLTVRKPPHFIILWDNNSPNWLNDIIQKNYIFDTTMAGFWIYRNVGRS